MTKLCVSLTEPTNEAMLAAMRDLPDYVDMVEFRLDYMRNPDVRALCRHKDRPIIVTNRPEREGGKFEGAEETRLSALREAAEAGADFIDVELDSVSELGPVGGQTGKIVSYHNFSETPANLQSVYSRIVETDPDVVKMAVKARDIVDTIRVFDLLNSRPTDLPLIALSMGEEGIATRILAGEFGAFLTFACLDEERSSAEGQVSYREMEELYRFSQIDAETRIYGVAADPVAHSMSPAIHNAAFAELGLNAVYLPLRVKQTRPFLDGYERLGLRGLSVTIPHKQSMVGLMDEVDELTERVGALNTICIKNGQRYGYNTDIAAALDSIEQASERAGLTPLSGCTAMIVGAGGAGRAIAYGLFPKVSSLVIANRTESRAETLAEELQAEWCGLDQMTDHQPDILINATSVGMHPRVEDSPVPGEMLRPGMVVFDSVYNPIETRLLREADQAGCTTASGLEWFVNQGAAQLEIWTEREAPRELMTEVVKRELACEEE